MWIIVISHLVAASCWSNSLKLHYDACPFFKCRWHSSDGVLRWHLRNRVETVISYSWWRLLTVYWLKQRVDALPNTMHLSISFCCSLWSLWKLSGKWWKCPPASACRYRWKMCIVSEVEIESRRRWAASDCYIPANGSASRGGAFVRHTALMDVVQSEHSGSYCTVCFPLQQHARRIEVRRGWYTEDSASVTFSRSTSQALTKEGWNTVSPLYMWYSHKSVCSLCSEVRGGAKSYSPVEESDL